MPQNLKTCCKKMHNECRQMPESGCFIDTASGNWSHKWLFMGAMQSFLGIWERKPQALALPDQLEDQRGRLGVCHRHLKPGFTKTHLWTACHLQSCCIRFVMYLSLCLHTPTEIQPVILELVAHFVISDVWLELSQQKNTCTAKSEIEPRF